MLLQHLINIVGGLPSRTDYLPQQPPRKKIMTRKATTATIITHSMKSVLSPEEGHRVPDPQEVVEIPRNA